MRKGLESIKGACPVCKGDVKGDDVYLFYCINCNILYKRDELGLNSPEHINAVMKEKVAQKYSGDKDKLSIEIAPMKNRSNKKINKKRKIKKN